MMFIYLLEEVPSCDQSSKGCKGTPVWSYEGPCTCQYNDHLGGCATEEGEACVVLCRCNPFFRSSRQVRLYTWNAKCEPSCI